MGHLYPFFFGKRVFRAEERSGAERESEGERFARGMKR